MFPSLVNCCTIDWFTEWPEDALEKVATKFLEDMDMDDEVDLSLLICMYLANLYSVRSVGTASKCVVSSTKVCGRLQFDI